MEAVVQEIFSPVILILGISRAVHARRWMELIAEIGKSRFAGFFIGIFALPTGLLIVAGHNLWVLDWPVFITLVGWGMAIKGTIYLVLPQAAEAVIERAGKSIRILQGTGMVMAAFGAILSWQVYFT